MNICGEPRLCAGVRVVPHAVLPPRTPIIASAWVSDTTPSVRDLVHAAKMVQLSRDEKRRMSRPIAYRDHGMIEQ